MIKQGAWLRKVWVQKAHVSQKIVLYFKGVIVNTEDYNQRSRSLQLRDKRHKQFYTPQKEKPTRKKKRKDKARSSVGRSSEKSHNTNPKFHFKEVIITSEDYKIFLYISENYNQQSRSLHLKKLQSSKSFFKLANNQSRQKPQEIEREIEGEREREREGERARERRGERENEGEGERKGGIGRKEGRIGIMEKAGLTSFPSEAHRPLRIRSPVQFHLWAGLGNNTIPTGGKLGKNTTPTNSKEEKLSAGPWLPN